MKATTKRITSLGIVIAYAVTILLGLLILIPINVFADSTTEVSSSQYFYDNLTYTDSDGNEEEFVFAKMFYRAIGDMHKKGDFKDGIVDYSLTDNNLATSGMIKAWVEEGDLTIPMAFSAARDAYYMDHPELFYIDIYKMTISAASIGDNYTAYIDSGREANLYAQGEFTSEAEVNTALTAYYNKINVIAEYAKAEAKKDKYGTAEKVLQARYANQYIATHTSYDDISAADSAITTASAAQNAYGALVKEKAVCNGYSRAFKAVMDKLDIPCVVVGGYSVAKNSEGGATEIGEAHAWNYVWFETPIDKDNEVATQADNDGAWYGYDVTWNSTGKSANAYIDMGSFAMLREHSPDGEISTSGYIVKYPQLSNYNYGCKTDSNGIVYSIDYFEVLDENGNVELDDDGNPLVNNWETVSFNGKGAIRLFEEDGLRLVYRRADMGEGGELRWTYWTDVYTEIKKGAFGELAYGDAVGYIDSGNEVKFFSNTSVLYSQFAVISGLDPDMLMWPFDENCVSGFSPESNIEDYFVVLSDLAVNDSYMTYVPAPHVVSSTPEHKEPVMISQSMAIPGTNQMDEKYAFEITVTYNEPLEIIDDTKPIGVSFTSASQYGSRTNIYDYARCIPIDESGTMVEIIDDYTLRFKFLPSLMYEHNGMHYYFTFSNVGSAYKNYRADGSLYISHKAPNVIFQRFYREYIACNKCLPNGRMLLDCVAQPTLLSNTDLSDIGFINPETNEYYSAGQRSQMMLVVEKPTEAENEKMNELLDNSTDISVSTEDIKKAETYEIDLQICGRYTYIPNNSYVKIALGFPEGYGPDDEGVTFKIYHYKRSADRKEIIGVEEIPCVVTPFGIVATVSSFSPFMVVAVDADKATTKNIYASVNGNGGKLNNADGQIVTLNEGGSHAYTIAPDNGYQIYKVTLNGENVTSKVANGQLTLTYDELSANNELEIMYISNEAAARYSEKGVTVVDPVKVVIPVGGYTYTDPYLNAGGPNSPNVGLIVGIVIGAAVVVTAGAAVAVVMLKKKKAANEEA